MYLQITIDTTGPNGVPDNTITAADPPLLPRQAILPVVFAEDSGNTRKLEGHDWSSVFDSGNPDTGTLLDAKIRDGSITGGKLRPETVTAVQIAEGTITAAQIASGTVTSNQIGSGKIDLSNLASQISDRLSPAGAISAFGGGAAQIPPGWLLCDGRAVSSVQFPRLFAAISRNWGGGVQGSTNDFNLPDLRGVFLRGLSADRSDSFSDPDAGTRASQNGSNSGNNIGSFQSDQIAKHSHLEHPGTGTVWFSRYRTDLGNWPNENDGNSLGQRTGDTGGAETRPKNAAVTYIIKY